jgi:hypothetical protein
MATRRSTNFTPTSPGAFPRDDSDRDDESLNGATANNSVSDPTQESRTVGQPTQDEDVQTEDEPNGERPVVRRSTHRQSAFRAAYGLDQVDQAAAEGVHIHGLDVDENYIDVMVGNRCLEILNDTAIYGCRLTVSINDQLDVYFQLQEVDGHRYELCAGEIITETVDNKEMTRDSPFQGIKDSAEFITQVHASPDRWFEMVT